MYSHMEKAEPAAGSRAPALAARHAAIGLLGSAALRMPILALPAAGQSP